MRCFLHFLRIGLVLGLATEAIAAQIFVHPGRGNDRTGNGSAQLPLRTISYALSIAREGSPTTIVLQPGVYNNASGETFPLRLKSGVILLGNEAQKGQGIIISGGGKFRTPSVFDQNVTMITTDRSEIRGVTITNPNIKGYGLWIEDSNPLITHNTVSQCRQDGVLITGKSKPTLLENRLIGNQGSNLSIEGVAQPLIQQNILQQSTFGVTIRQQAAPRLISNAINANQNGVMVQAQSQPILRGNVIENNRQNGVIVLGDALPDLGTVTEAGRNTWRGNGSRDIHNGSSQQLSALGNMFTQARVFGKVGLDVASTNTVLTSSSFNAITPILFKNTALTVEKVPNSVVVRIAGSMPQSLGVSTKIDTNLPPVTLQPPNGGVVVAAPVTAEPVRPLLPLRFRVVVPVFSEDQKLTVRKLVPEAFPIHRSGQDFVQVGAFNSAKLAEDRVQQLGSIGLTAQVEQF